MQIAPLGAIFVFGLINLKMEAFMSNKKEYNNYQFLINEPKSKPSKKKLKKVGDNSESKLVLHVKNYLKKIKEKNNG